MLTHHLAGVDLFARIDEEAAAILQLVHGIRHGDAGLVGHQRTVGALFDVALVGLVILETVCHHGFTLGGGQQVAAEAHQAAGRNLKVEVHTVAAGLHPEQGALPAGGHLDGTAHEFFGHVDGQRLDRLTALAADGLVEHAGLAYLQFKSFAAHGLDEDREMQHTAAIDHERVGVDARLDAQGQVLLEFALQALLDMAGGHEFAFAAKERRVVDGEDHAHRGFIHGDGRQGLRVLEVGDGVADLEAFDAHHGAEVAALDALDLALLQSFEDHQVLDLLFLHDIIALAERYRHAGTQGAPGHAAHGDAAHIRGVLQRGDEHLRGAFHDLRSGNLFDDGVEQRGDVGGRLAPVTRHPALLGTAVDGLEVELLLRGIEREHQVEHLFVDLVGAAVQLVHLVDDDNGLLAHLKGLLEHEAGLRHGAFEGIDQQQHAVGHVEHALHLAAEVGMAGGVDDVDLDILVGD